MQKVSFPIEVRVHDDASTDKSQDIIREYQERYPDVLKPIFQSENQYSKGGGILARFLIPMCEGKYIALCEGDDYWIDPLKLQKQVDFLEDHPDYSLCCHRYKIYNQNDGTWADDYVKKLFEESPNGFSFGNFENLNKVWITKTVTLVYRVNSINPADLMKYHYRCDEHLNYHLLRNGSGYCFPFVGAVYRRCDAGIFSPLSDKEKIKRWCNIRGEMLKFNITDGDIRNNVYHVLRWYLYDRQFCGEMVKLMMACVMSFYRTDGFKSSLLCVKKFLVSYVKGLKKRTRTDA